MTSSAPAHAAKKIERKKQGVPVSLTLLVTPYFFEITIKSTTCRPGGSSVNAMEQNTTQFPRWKPLAKRLSCAALIAYSVALGLLMFLERTLIYPLPDARFGDWSPSGFVYEDIWLNAGDGTKLHNWYLPCNNPQAVVVFFHGNGEDIAACGPELARLRNSLRISVLVVDYRGYGKSEGKPGEKAIVADGILAAKWLAEREDVKPDQLVLWGRSIGGGVAAGVAESINPRAMIMECTFDSLANVAAHHIWWAPVRWLMSNQYHSAERLKDYQGEFLQWHGDADNIVPIAAAKRLFDAVGSPNKSFVLGEGRGHNEEAPTPFQVQVGALLNSNLGRK